MGMVYSYYWNLQEDMVVWGDESSRNFTVRGGDKILL